MDFNLFNFSNLGGISSIAKNPQTDTYTEGGITKKKPQWQIDMEAKNKAPNIPDRSNTILGKAAQATNEYFKTNPAILSQGPKEIFGGISQGLQNTATSIKNAGYSDAKGMQDKQKSFISDMLAKGYDKDAIFKAMDELKAQGKFQGSITENPITGTLSSIVSAPLQAVSTIAKGGESAARAGELIQEGDVSGASATYAKGLTQGALGGLGLSTGFTPGGAAVNTAFSSETVGQPLEKYVSAPIREGVAIGQEALGYDSQSEGSKALQETAGMVGPLAVLGGAQKYIAPRVVPVAKNILSSTPSITNAGKIVAKPFSSIINTAKKYTGTPEEVSGIQSAIKPKQKIKNGVLQRTQENINSEIKLTNGLIRESRKSPTDLASYKDAIKGEMEKVGSEINRLTGQDLTIDLTPTASKIRQIANSKEVQLLDPSESGKLLRMADDIEANGRLSLHDAEAMNQFINDTLKSTTTSASEAYKRGLQTLVGDIRQGLDDTISNIPGQFKDIKKTYGALRNVYGDTVAREIVYNRQNMGGLVDSIGAIEGAGNIISGGLKFITGRFGEGVSDIGKGITQNAVGRFIKGKNDPNNIIRSIFQKGGEKRTIPNVESKKPFLLGPATGKPTSAKVSNVKPISATESGKLSKTNTALSGKVGERPGLIKPTTKQITNAPKPLINKPTTTTTKSESVQVPEGYFKNAFGEIVKKPNPKKAGFIKNPLAKSEPLIEEAKKYKSAEEFVKAQGEPVYHGTNAKFDEFSKDYINKNSGMEYGVGFYFTPDKQFASNYGKVKELYVNIKNPFNMEGIEGLSKVEKLGITQKDYKKMKGKGKYVEREVLTDIIKRNGYDGIIYKGRGDYQKAEIIAFEPSQIKTKQQLTDIYNQAHKHSILNPKAIGESVGIGKVPDELKGLAEEAKKYKSADEFIESKLRINDAIKQATKEINAIKNKGIMDDDSIKRVKYWEERLNLAKKGTPKRNFIVRIGNRELSFESAPDMESIIEKALSEYDKLGLKGGDRISWVSGKDVNIRGDIPKTRDQLKKIYEQAMKKTP